MTFRVDSFVLNFQKTGQRQTDTDRNCKEMCALRIVWRIKNKKAVLSLQERRLLLRVPATCLITTCPSLCHIQQFVLHLAHYRDVAALHLQAALWSLSGAASSLTLPRPTVFGRCRKQCVIYGENEPDLHVEVLGSLFWSWCLSDFFCIVVF